MSSVSAQAGKITIGAGGSIYDTTGGERISVSTSGLLDMKAGGDIGGQSGQALPLRIDARMVDVVSANGDIRLEGLQDIEVQRLQAGPTSAVQLAPVAGSIRLAPQAQVSGGTVWLESEQGDIQADAGARILAEFLRMTARDGVGSPDAPIATSVDRIEISSQGGSVDIVESDGLEIVGAGVSLGGAGPVSIAVQSGDLVMAPDAALSTAGGQVSLAAGGSVGLSVVASGAGAIKVAAGEAIYQTTDGSQVNLQSTSSLTLQAGSGIGGFGSAQLRVDVGTVEASNGASGSVVIAGERGLTPGPAGVVSASEEGWVALFSASGRVQPGKVESASGRLLMLSGKTGLTEKETESVLALLSMPASDPPAVTLRGSGAGASSGQGADGASGDGMASSLTTSAPSLSGSSNVLGAPSRTSAGGGLGGAAAQTGFAGGEDGTTTASGASANGQTGVGRNAAAVKSGNASTQQLGDRMSEGYSIGSASLVGRSTAVMLDAALRVTERSPWIGQVDQTSLGELLARTAPEPGDRAPAPDAQPAAPVPVVPPRSEAPAPLSAPPQLSAPNAPVVPAVPLAPAAPDASAPAPGSTPTQPPAGDREGGSTAPRSGEGAEGTEGGNGAAGSTTPDGPSGTNAAADPMGSDTMAEAVMGAGGRSGGWLAQAGTWWSRLFGARHVPVAAAEVSREAERSTALSGESPAPEAMDGPVAAASDPEPLTAAHSKEVRGA